MSGAPTCEHLPWDSEFFGRRIARVCGNRLDASAIEALEKWCSEHAVECLYFLADPDDPATIRLAEDHRFRMVDIRVTFGTKLTSRVPPAPSGALSIRPFAPGDAAALQTIARGSHRHSRFYRDGRFPAERCDDLYATWIEKSCQGYAEAVLVAEADDRAVGYISCHVDPDEGRIGLVAVADGMRGKGVGHALVHAALDWLAARGLSRASVVTQGTNAEAQRLYERCGFTTRTIQLWYHRWFDRC